MVTQGSCETLVHTYSAYRTGISHRLFYETGIWKDLLRLCKDLQLHSFVSCLSNLGSLLSAVKGRAVSQR
ncbi:hypothetical protein I79_013049 [Cricetulus griseus]|uniref:Uncharacterized protein n=1 Tax=Cricetulus griseus TaxID=10029 RepID=G3HQE9_CRIGR|nr:hypothetical protein I79_013049 [Cricetulus griseus]